MPKDHTSNLPRRIAAALLGLALYSVPGTGAADPGPATRRIERTALPTTPAAPSTGPRLDLWTFELDEHAAGPVAQDPQRQPAPPPPATTPIARDAAPDENTAAPEAAAGAVRLAYDSLIHRDVERRGTATSWGLGPRTQFKGFQLAPSPKVDQGTALRDDVERYRLRGMLVEHDLVLRHLARLQLVGGWLADGATPGQTAPHGGHSASAWSLGGRASLLADSLRLSFEYAGSRPTSRDALGESDAGSTAAVADGVGQAYAATAEFRATPHDDRSWHLGAEYRWIGPRFDSIANPTLHRDRQRLRTFGGVGFDDWRIEMGVEQERDNLLQDPSSPTRHRDRYEVSANWQPATSGTTTLLGRPRITLAADIERSRERLAAASDGLPQARRGRRIRLESEFTTPHWRWGIAAVGGIADGLTDARTGVVRNTRLRLYGEPQAGAVLPVRPALSWQRHDDDAAGAADASWRADLATRPLELREDLRARLRLGYRQRGQPATGRTEDDVKIGASLVWTLQRPTAGRRGLALAVSGSIGGDTAGAASSGPGDYGLALSLTTDNPLAGW